MFKSSRSPYRKQRRTFRPLIIFLSLPLLLVVLEGLLRLGVAVTGQEAEFAVYEGEPAAVTAYRLRFLDTQGRPYDGLPRRGHLTARRSALQGYQLVENQQNAFWQINQQGFRSDAPVPLAKPKDEVRIFVLGGSTAFGYRSLNNQTTFASKLETRLNQQIAQQKQNPEKFRPDVLSPYLEEVQKQMARSPKIRNGRYRVINAAVPGYTSGNELAQLALQILAYSPDLIVVVNGYSDLMLPSPQAGADIPGADGLLKNATQHFFSHWGQQVETWLGQTYLVKGAQYWVLRPQESVDELSLVATKPQGTLVQHLPAEPKELEGRVARYGNHLQQMARLTAAARIPLIIATQPEITGRNSQNIAAEEQKILTQLGATYSDRVKQAYPNFAKAAQQVQQQFPQNVTALNLYDLYAKFPGQAFYDAVHLTDEANTVLSNRLYDTVFRLMAVQPKSYEEAMAR